MACPYCGARQTRLDRSLAGREVCAICGFPVVSNKALPVRRVASLCGKVLKAFSARHRHSHFFSRPVGYGLTLLAVVVGSLLPSLAPLSRKEFVAIANSSIPAGLPRDAFGELAQEPLFRAVIRNGGQIVLVNSLLDSRDRFGDAGLGSVAGLWSPGSGTMKLRIGDFTYEQYLSVLSHESIHMAQSCRANSLKANPVPLGLPVTAEGILQLEPYRRSNPSYYLSRVEREAHSHENGDPVRIAEWLDAECGGRPWIPLFGRFRSSLQALLLR